MTQPPTAIGPDLFEVPAPTPTPVDPRLKGWRFRVVGTPVPQGSKNAYVNRHTGRAVVVDTNKALLRPWRAMVADAARQAGVVRIDAGPVALRLRFIFLRPPSKPKRVTHPAVRPDLDKLERSILDSLTGIAFADDAQVCRIEKTKEYVRAHEVPGLEAEVWAL